MKNPRLTPTPNQTFELEGFGPCDFAAVLDRSCRLQAQNRMQEACDERFAAVQRIIASLPDDEEIILEFNHRNSRAALQLLLASAEDHFLASDFEMAAALTEQLLELDPEDRLEATTLTAFCYVALGEYELLDEILPDIADSQAEKPLLMLWAAFRRTASLPRTELDLLRERFPAAAAEFARDDHPADETYLAGIDSERPSREVQARHLWLRTEHLWQQHSDFADALRNALRS